MVTHNNKWRLVFSDKYHDKKSLISSPKKSSILSPHKSNVHRYISQINPAVTDQVCRTSKTQKTPFPAGISRQFVEKVFFIFFSFLVKIIPKKQKKI